MGWHLRGIVLAGVALALAGTAGTGAADVACAPGDWLLPASRETVGFADHLGSVAPGTILLLGETHDDARHHRWQASVISGLLARGLPVTLGFEAFPRRLQPVLDRWTAGELDDAAFAEAVEWDEVWGFDFGLYLPLFELARLHRLPMAALNVERSLVSRVGKAGWQALPPADREGLGDPAPPPEAYRAILREIFAGHASLSETDGDEADEGEPADGDATADEERAAVLAARELRFSRFVEAQLTWDRAMAEALAAHARAGSVTVGIIGSGHLRRGHGVAWQLRDLGAGSVTWLPIEPGECAELPEDLADAVVVLDVPPPAVEPPRLGVALLPGEAGLRIMEVVADSVAAHAGILENDIIRSIANQPIQALKDVRTIMKDAQPGAWLPIVIERDGVSLALIARFRHRESAAPVEPQ